MAALLRVYHMSMKEAVLEKIEQDVQDCIKLDDISVNRIKETMTWQHSKTEQAIDTGGG